jgi:hypothetical protein
MGKSAYRLLLKAAKIHPVAPRPDSKGVQQPPYLRSGTAIQTSPRLKRFQSCMARKLAGQKPGSRLAARERFAAAARECQAEVR